MKWNDLVRLIEAAGGYIRQGKGSERIAILGPNRYSFPKSSPNATFHKHVVAQAKRKLGI